MLNHTVRKNAADFILNEAIQTPPMKCSHGSPIENTAQNWPGCPEMMQFRSFSEDNLLTLHIIQTHWQDDAIKSRNVHINSLFVLSGSVGYLGIWAQGSLVFDAATDCQQWAVGQGHFGRYPLVQRLQSLSCHERSDHPEIWQTPQQQCCRGPCQISETLRWFKQPISRLRDFTRSYDNTSYQILRWGQCVSNGVTYFLFYTLDIVMSSQCWDRLNEVQPVWHS